MSALASIKWTGGRLSSRVLAFPAAIQQTLTNAAMQTIQTAADDIFVGVRRNISGEPVITHDKVDYPTAFALVGGNFSSKHMLDMRSGNLWRSLRIKDTSAVERLAYTVSNPVWYGAELEFGYINDYTWDWDIKPWFNPIVDLYRETYPLLARDYIIGMLKHLETSGTVRGARKGRA